MGPHRRQEAQPMGPVGAAPAPTQPGQKALGCIAGLFAHGDRGLPLEAGALLSVVRTGSVRSKRRGRWFSTYSEIV